MKTLPFNILEEDILEKEDNEPTFITHCPYFRDESLPFKDQIFIGSKICRDCHYNATLDHGVNEVRCNGDEFNDNSRYLESKQMRQHYQDIMDQEDDHYYNTIFPCHDDWDFRDY